MNLPLRDGREGVDYDALRASMAELRGAKRRSDPSPFAILLVLPVRPRGGEQPDLVHAHLYSGLLTALPGERDQVLHDR